MADIIDMLSEQEIMRRLEEKGFRSGQVRSTMQEVGKLIIARTAVAYLDLFPEAEREHIKSLPDDEVQAYLASRGDTLPQMPQETFDAIHDRTWEEYFNDHQ